MKVIFLDIDGVMNDASTLMTDDRPHEPHLSLLKQIVNETGAEIILSSSWRFYVDLTNQVKERLATVGLKLSGITTDLSSRGKEILKWLEEHPETTNFVILDDEYHNFKSCGLKNNLVKTDFSTGLREVHVKKAIKILNQNV